MEIKPYDLVFVRKDSSVWSFIISLFTRIPYVHVMLVTSNTDWVYDIDYSYEAGIRTISNWDSTRLKVKYFPNMTDEQKQKICEYCIAYSGAPYDLLEGIGIADDPHALYCASLVYEAYKNANIDLCGKLSFKNLFNSKLLRDR